MKIAITDHAIWKFPDNNFDTPYWIWLSEKHSSIFFSLENKIAIYNDFKKEWKEISLEEYENDSECVEALTTTDNYLIFAGFAGDFEVYEMPHLKYIKTIDTENSGYGAASFKNNVFMNDHDPIGIKMVEIPSGQIIREFPILDVLSEDYLLNSISCNEKYVTGYFEGTEDNYFITWDFHNGSLISKISTTWEGFEDPILLKGNLIISNDKICDLITSEVVIEIDLLENEYILTAIDNHVFTLIEDYNDENEIKRIRTYNKRENKFCENLEFEADDVHTFKNVGDYILILKEDFFYLIPLKSLIERVIKID